MKRIRNIFTILFAIFIMMILSSCDSGGDEDRGTGSGDLVIAVVWPDHGGLRELFQGVDLAVNAINAKDGLLNKRKIRILKYDDEDNVNTAILVAQKIKKNKDIIAVIGHYRSYASLPTSAVYQFSNILMINPSSTSSKMSENDYPLVFRIIPDDIAQGEELAEFAKQQNYKNMIIFYESSDYGREIANAFEKKAYQLNIKIVERMPFHTGDRNFENELQDWKRLYRFDAVLLAGNPIEAARIIKEARALEIKQPFVGGNRLHSQLFTKVGGSAVNGTVMVTTFHHTLNDPQPREFVRRFRQQYGKAPNAWAALGYDSMNLIATAIRKAKSASPPKMAKELSSLKNWPGVAANYTFNKIGDMIEPHLVAVIVKNGKFELYSRQSYKKAVPSRNVTTTLKDHSQRNPLQ